MNLLFKILGFLMTVLFAWAAFVQHNDPDALKWYAIYGAAALASLLFTLNKLRILIALFLLGFFVALAVLNWPTKFEGVTIGEGDIENIEKGREALGMLIAALVMGIYSLRIRATKTS